MFLVGHSLGGILPGLMECGDLVDAMVTVASENVYWRYRHGRTRALYLSRVSHFGYFKPFAQPLWGEAISWLTQQPHRSTPGT